MNKHTIYSLLIGGIVITGCVGTVNLDATDKTNNNVKTENTDKTDKTDTTTQPIIKNMIEPTGEVILIETPDVVSPIVHETTFNQFFIDNKDVFDYGVFDGNNPLNQNSHQSLTLDVAGTATFTGQMSFKHDSFYTGNRTDNEISVDINFDTRTFVSNVDVNIQTDDSAFTGENQPLHRTLCIGYYRNNTCFIDYNYYMIGAFDTKGTFSKETSIRYRKTNLDGTDTLAITRIHGHVGNNTIIGVFNGDGIQGGFKADRK